MTIKVLGERISKLNWIEAVIINIERQAQGVSITITEDMTVIEETLGEERDHTTTTTTIVGNSNVTNTTSNVKTVLTNMTIKFKTVSQGTTSNRDLLEGLTIVSTIGAALKIISTIEAGVTIQTGTDSKTGSTAGPATRRTKITTSRKKNDNSH